MPRTSFRISSLVTCLAAGAFAFTLLASPASAQGLGLGHLKHHDSSNPGQTHGKGRGHDGTPPLASLFSEGGVMVDPGMTAAAGQAAVALGASLRNGTFTALGGGSISADTRALFVRLLTDADGAAAASLARSLQAPSNRMAEPEAAELASALEGLLFDPGTLPNAVVAFNALVDQSSEDFLRDPPAQFHAVRAVIAAMLEPTLRAMEEVDASGGS